MAYLFRWSLVLSFFLVGCFYRVDMRAHGHKKPSTVTVYVKIDQRPAWRGKRPVGDLDVNKFRIKEDGRPVVPQESRQVIIKQQAGTIHYTMLLLDLSGSMAKSSQIKPLEGAVNSFASRLSEIQRVGIYAFDGSAKIKQIVPFTDNPSELRAGISDIQRFTPTDPSTNLYGGVVDGLRILTTFRDKPDNPKLSFATLVVFTDGSDLAHRTTKKDLREAIKDARDDKDKKIRIYAVGLGDKVDQGTLRMIGKDGDFTADEGQELNANFGRVADRIEENSHSYYLLSYCSPARDGEHTLTVKIVDGDLNLRRGKQSYKFNAEGFTAKCDPNDIAPLIRPSELKAQQKQAKEAAREQKKQEKAAAKAQRKSGKKDQPDDKKSK
jgi:uncharacterized protein YegL